MTKALLHSIRTTAHFKVFGHPDVNVKCVGQLKPHMEGCGHDVKLVLNSPKSVLYMLEEVVVEEKKQSNEVAGIKWLSIDKKIFIKEWKR